ncbi:helix-turn-helix domain-containing protein [Vibrio harveyi]|uniref:helix-turn-helix domain-containing protein n=1 Tax=Vibrio harveyi TaxID=669 RepID=UPI00384AB6E7
MRPKKYKDQDIIDQFNQGINRERISKNIGCSYYTVCRIIKAHVNNKNSYRRK